MDYYKNVQRRSNLRLQGFPRGSGGKRRDLLSTGMDSQNSGSTPSRAPTGDREGPSHPTEAAAWPGCTQGICHYNSTLPEQGSHPLCCPSKGRAQVWRFQNHDLSRSFSHTTQEEDGFLPTEETSASGWLGIRPELPSDFVDRNQEW